MPRITLKVENDDGSVYWLKSESLQETCMDIAGHEIADGELAVLIINVAGTTYRTRPRCLLNKLETFSVKQIEALTKRIENCNFGNDWVGSRLRSTTVNGGLEYIFELVLLAKNDALKIKGFGPESFERVEIYLDDIDVRHGTDLTPILSLMPKPTQDRLKKLGVTLKWLEKVHGVNDNERQGMYRHLGYKLPRIAWYLP